MLLQIYQSLSVKELRKSATICHSYGQKYRALVFLTHSVVTYQFSSLHTRHLTPKLQNDLSIYDSHNSFYCKYMKQFNKSHRILDTDTFHKQCQPRTNCLVLESMATSNKQHKTQCNTAVNRP